MLSLSAPNGSQQQAHNKQPGKWARLGELTAFHRMLLRVHRPACSFLAAYTSVWGFILDEMCRAC